jgi:hypothetical protein
MLIITGFLLVFSAAWTIPSNAQDQPDFSRIDSLTWAAYARADWHSVRSGAREGFSKGIDYYYLRMRAGIAEYMLKNYDQAAVHFAKALNFNETDQTAAGYLYFSYLLTNRDGDAARIAGNLSPAYRDSLKIKSRPLKVFFEGGSFYTPERDSLLNYTPGGISAHSYQVDKYSLASFGSSAVLSPRISLTLAFQRINYNITEQYKIMTLDPYVFDVSYGENSFYAGTRIMLGTGLSLLGGFRFMNGQFAYHTAQAYPGGINFVETTGEYSDLLNNLTLFKRFPYAGLSLSADLNRFKGSWYGQSGMSLSLYPMGNLNLYFTGELSRTGPLNGWLDNGNLIWKGKAGARLLPFTWVEASFTKGWIRYWSENQAYFAYNNFDPITSRFEVSFIFPGLFKHVDLSAKYNTTTRIAGWEIADPSGASQIVGKNYSFHSFILSGTWTF